MKQKINGYITHEMSAYTGKSIFSFQTYRPSAVYSPEIVVVRAHSIEVDVPDDFDPRPGLVDALKEKQRQAAADFEKLCTDIQRQISKLEALEFSGAPS